MSRTAWRVAVRRAEHQLLDRPLVLDDPIAVPILGGDTAAALRENPSAFERGPFDVYLRAFMVARARFAEDHLDAARDRGVRQYVILGAGLDTFAYRQGRVEPPLTIWEIDRPETQVWKQARLAAGGIPVPANLRFVAVDFENDVLPEALARAGFDPAAGAVFAWLGVTMYLTPEAIDRTLRAVAAAVGACGGIAFDYAMDRALMSPAGRAAFDALAARVERVGEPWRTTFDPTALASRLGTLGFGAVEDAGGDELNARYFAGRADGLRVGSLARMMWAGGTLSKVVR
ncbi:MAG TPA: class I SAM-dependent methyltransferase [Vicinamibacterales bacterium]